MESLLINRRNCSKPRHVNGNVKIKIVLNTIIDFVSEETTEKNINANTDIENELGCTGDDFDEMMEKYSKRFNVDMTNYKWYFHSTEDGGKFIGGIFFKPPYELVKRIPITPKMLADFAEIGKWNIDYPEHKIPKKRYDLLINFIIGIIVVIWFIYSLIDKYL